MRIRCVLIAGILLAACQSASVQPDSMAGGTLAPGTPADPTPIHQEGSSPVTTGPATEADRLLQADRNFSAHSLSRGAPEAFYQWLDEYGMQLPAAGEPVVGPDKVRDSLAQGPPTILSWEPRYAEVLNNDWGWTWGEWQAHEPGAGGRRIGQGKYVNLWKKQPDGSWKVRMDMGNVERVSTP